MQIILEFLMDYDVRDILDKMVEIKKDRWATILELSRIENGKPVFISPVLEAFIKSTDKKTLQELVEAEK